MSACAFTHLSRKHRAGPNPMLKYDWAAKRFFAFCASSRTLRFLVK